jgi:uncharacterized membrane protein YesL
VGAGGDDEVIALARFYYYYKKFFLKNQGFGICFPKNERIITGITYAINKRITPKITHKILSFTLSYFFVKNKNPR